MCLVGNYFSCFLIAVGFQSEEKQLENFKDRIQERKSSPAPTKMYSKRVKSAVDHLK